MYVRHDVYWCFCYVAKIMLIMKKDIKASIIWASTVFASALMCSSCDKNEMESAPDFTNSPHDTIKCGVIQLRDIHEAVINDSASYIVADDTLRMERKSVAQVIGAKNCHDDAEWDLWYCSSCREYYLAAGRKASFKYTRLDMIQSLVVECKWK